MISLFFANLIGWISEHKLITLLLLIIAFGGIYYACSQNALKNDLEREKEARSQEHQERIEDSKTEVNAAANISNQAEEKFNKAVNRDSSSYEPSQAEDKFCSRFKCDSSCEAWRKINGVNCN